MGSETSREIDLSRIDEALKASKEEQKKHTDELNDVMNEIRNEGDFKEKLEELLMTIQNTEYHSIRFSEEGPKFFKLVSIHQGDATEEQKQNSGYEKMTIMKDYNLLKELQRKLENCFKIHYRNEQFLDVKSKALKSLYAHCLAQYRNMKSTISEVSEQACRVLRKQKELETYIQSTLSSLKACQNDILEAIQSIQEYNKIQLEEIILAEDIDVA